MNEKKKCLSCPTMITTGDYYSQCSDTPDGRSEIINYGDDGIELTQEQVTELIMSKPETEMVEDIMDFVEPEDYTETEYKNVTLVEPAQNEDKIREAFKKCVGILKFPTERTSKKFVSSLGLFFVGEEHRAIGFYLGYKSALKQSQQEIEEIKKNAQSCCSKYQVLLEDTKAIYSEHKDQLSENDNQIEELQDIISIQKEDLENTRILSSEKDKQIEKLEKELSLYKGMVV